jgi:hypothetical protein
VYNEATSLALAGEAIVAPSGTGRWKTYAASDEGLGRGQEILGSLPAETREYLEGVAGWVRSLSFGSLVKSIYDAYPEMKQNSIFRE